jgi:GrpB-like predicted nucleotidyltransferase (UPF0157 family)
MVVVTRVEAEDVDDCRRRLAEVTIGTPQRLTGAIVLAAHDLAWNEAYRRHALQIGEVLGERVLRIAHVGSTAVPGLPAKPIIDIVLEVADSADEAAYAPRLEEAGYLARVREPDWFQHRLFRTPVGNVNLHVFCGGCPETERMIQFRDWLRSNRADRYLYTETKRELA